MRRIAAHSTVARPTAIAALEAPVIRVALVTVLAYHVRLTRTDAHHIVALGRSTFTAGTCDDKQNRDDKPIQMINQL